MWVKVNADSVAGDQNTIFFYGLPGSTRRTFAIDTDGITPAGNVKIQVFTWGDDINGLDTGVAPGNFFHIAATYDGGTTLKAYINGVLRATHNLGGVLNTLATDVNIGRFPGGGSVGESFFGGLIDEVEIFSRDLSPTEIAAIYNAGLAGKCKNQPPEAICKDVTVNTAPGTCSANASVDNGSFDPDGDPITLVRAPPGPYNKGNTSVTLTVTDDSGASDSCTATVTVVDNEKPSISCPASQTVECTSPSGATASYSPPTVSDNCTGAITTGCSPTSGSSFPLGTTSVTCSATDSSGNTNTCSTGVTVVDTVPPTVTAALVRVAGNDDDKDKHKKKSKDKKHGDGHDGDDDDDEGRFQVVFSCTDICSSSVTVTAKLNGISVTNGQIVKLERDKHSEVEMEHGVLEIEAPSFELAVTCTDASGNVGTAKAAPTFTSNDHDKKKDKDDRDKKKGKK